MSNPSMRRLRSSAPCFRRMRLSPTRPIRQATLPQTSRHSSTTAGDARSLATRLKNFLYGTSLTLVIGFSYLYVTDTRASVHQWLAVPMLRYLYPDAEEAHHFGTQALKTLYEFGLHPRERTSESEEAKNAALSVIVFGQRLQSPIGTSAGLDKLAEIPDALLALGPAVVEVGGATPLPQDGNPKPRVFRLPSQRALINRYGLNSLGADDMAMRLQERVRVFAYNRGLGTGQVAEDTVLNGGAGVPPGSLVEGKLLAVQVAKNKFTKDEDIEAVKNDYVYCVERLAPYADILVVNVSSPNTPGLRGLQKVEPLTTILKGVVGAARACKRNTTPKVMVKVSPDEDEDEQMEGIVDAIWKSGVDGVIVGNTTKRRTNLLSQNSVLSAKDWQTLNEQGGYSGPAMFERTLSLVKRYRQLLDQGPSPPSSDSAESVSAIPSSDEPVSTITEKIEYAKKSVTEATGKLIPGYQGHEQKVIFATGGITNGKQALEILNAGASVAQIYTALIYGGVGTVSKIKREMRDEVAKK